MKTKQLCPRRGESGVEAGGPFNVPKTDYWEHRKGGNKFRFCSWCGCLHPEDAIAEIIKDDSIWGKTDKNYKFYLNGKQFPNNMAKAYIQHFNPAQIDRLNKALGFRNHHGAGDVWDEHK